MALPSFVNASMTVLAPLVPDADFGRVTVAVPSEEVVTGTVTVTDRRDPRRVVVNCTKTEAFATADPCRLTVSAMVGSLPATARRGATTAMISNSASDRAARAVVTAAVSISAAADAASTGPPAAMIASWGVAVSTRPVMAFVAAGAGLQAHHLHWQTDTGAANNIS